MVLARRSLLLSALAAPALVRPGIVRAQPLLERVEILLDWRPLPTYAGFFLARERGAFERRGIAVTFAETQGAIASTEAIGTGKPHWIGTSSGAATAIGRSRGQPVRSLAVYYQRTPTVVYSRTEDRIAHPRDLAGKAVGVVPGSVTGEELRAMFLANNLDPDSIRRVTVDGTATALLDRKVDALVDYEEMSPTELVAEDRRITMVRLADFGVRLYSLNLVVNDAAWADPVRRATAQKVVDAVQEGYDMVKEHPAGAAAQFASLFPRLSPRYVDRSMVSVARQLSGPPTGVQTRAGWEATLRTLEQLKLLARPVTVDEVAILPG